MPAEKARTTTPPFQLIKLANMAPGSQARRVARASSANLGKTQQTLVARKHHISIVKSPLILLSGLFCVHEDFSATGFKII